MTSLLLNQTYTSMDVGLIRDSITHETRSDQLVLVEEEEYEGRVNLITLKKALQ